MNDTDRSRAPTVDELHVGRVYAEALWNVAEEQGVTNELIEEYRSLVADVLDPEPQLEAFFSLASLTQDRRTRMLEHIFAGRASELLYNFMLTLNKHDRLGLLRAVGVRLEELWREKEGLAPVLVRTAEPMADEQAEALRVTLRERFKLEPDLEFQVDPEMLGGLWLRMGDTVYDRSVRRNLRVLRDNMLKRYSHEIQSGRDIVDRSG